MRLTIWLGCNGRATIVEEIPKLGALAFVVDSSESVNCSSRVPSIQLRGFSFGNYIVKSFD